jgi:hypothetical protein
MAVEVSLMALAGGIARRVRPRLLGAAALLPAACALASCGGGMPCEAAALNTVPRDNELKSDLAHPNTKGYAKLAEAVAALLTKKRRRIAFTGTFGKNHPAVRKLRLDSSRSEACSI